MSPSQALRVMPDAPLCQRTLPLDWYQPEFRPYAEEFLALDDHSPASVLAWLDAYVTPALQRLGDRLLLVAHSYMGGEIVRIVRRFGGYIGDSYELARIAAAHPEKKLIVQAAVHFMAEAIAILADDEQRVFITNPKAGCTMEMLARDHMVLPVFDQLRERYGDIAVVAYMNTSGRLKALAGRTAGSVCTSSNAHLVLDWALRHHDRVFFVPDRNLARNTARRLALAPHDLAVLPDPESPDVAAPLHDLPPASLEALDRARIITWGAYCGVHTVFTPAHVRYWHDHGYRVIVHPEASPEVVDLADDTGSTRRLWDIVTAAPAGSRFAVGTEGHFVRNLAREVAPRDIAVVHLAHTPTADARYAGCACATMSRNDPPHLAAMLDLLARGQPPDINRVLPGDTIDEATMRRDRLQPEERRRLRDDARDALQRMIDITEAATQ